LVSQSQSEFFSPLADKSEEVLFSFTNLKEFFFSALCLKLTLFVISVATARKQESQSSGNQRILLPTVLSPFQFHLETWGFFVFGLIDFVTKISFPHLLF
jgi:hypothetical protein